MMLAKMKQSSSDDNNVYSEDFFLQEDEYEVAVILLQLAQLILRSQLHYLLNLSWGSKKRRTSFSVTPSPSSASPSPSTHHHNQPPPHPLTTYCEEEEEEDGEKGPISKVNDTSPDTPLSCYPHSESDSKRKPHKRKLSKKKTKEELEEIVMNISDQNDTFKKEVEKVREHYNALKALNMKLKSKFEELSNSQDKNGKLELGSSERGTSLDLLVEEPKTASSPALEQPEVEPKFVHQPQPLLIDQNPFKSAIFENTRYSFEQMAVPSMTSGIGLGMAENMSPLGIPDLNFTANYEETGTSINSTGLIQQLDLRKAVITAEARRRRIELTKVKKSMAIAKTRLQIR